VDQQNWFRRDVDCFVVALVVKRTQAAPGFEVAAREYESAGNCRDRHALCPLKREQIMGHHDNSWHMGWIVATIAFVAAALLIINIAVHRGETLTDVFGAATPAAHAATIPLA
jgi:hypothetical protein